MLWCCVFTEMEIISISNTKLEFKELFLERKKHFTIVHGFLNERAWYLRDRIYSDITNLWVYEHSIVHEKFSQSYVRTQSKSSGIKPRLLHCTNPQLLQTEAAFKVLTAVGELDVSLPPSVATEDLKTASLN